MRGPPQNTENFDNWSGQNFLEFVPEAGGVTIKCMLHVTCHNRCHNGTEKYLLTARHFSKRTWATFSIYPRTFCWKFAIVWTWKMFSLCKRQVFVTTYPGVRQAYPTLGQPSYIQLYELPPYLVYVYLQLV